MMSDRFYKLAFIFAVTLHAVIMFLFVIKFTNSRSTAFNPVDTFINVNVVTNGGHNIFPKQEKTGVNNSYQKTVVLNKKAEAQIRIKNILQKKLLSEEIKEIAALKKEKKLQQLQNMMRDQLVAEQKQLVNEQFQAKESKPHEKPLEAGVEIDRYKAMVKQAIISQWIVPDGIDKNSSGVILLINVAPGGVVLSVQLLTSSGNEILDRSAKAAVLKSSPLPVPQDTIIFDEFRTIKLKFTPQGTVEN